MAAIRNKHSAANDHKAFYTADYIYAAQNI